MKGNKANLAGANAVCVVAMGEHRKANQALVVARAALDRAKRFERVVALQDHLRALDQASAEATQKLHEQLPSLGQGEIHSAVAEMVIRLQRQLHAVINSAGMIKNLRMNYGALVPHWKQVAGLMELRGLLLHWLNMDEY